MLGDRRRWRGESGPRSSRASSRSSRNSYGRPGFRPQVMPPNGGWEASNRRNGPGPGPGSRSGPRPGPGPGPGPGSGLSSGPGSRSSSRPSSVSRTRRGPETPPPPARGPPGPAPVPGTCTRTRSRSRRRRRRRRRLTGCELCTLEFVYGDAIRYLPCLHAYHVHCVDDWLLRSLTCPSCLEPVDVAELSSYEIF